jgi:broad specificity phosphatase PhoE
MTTLLLVRHAAHDWLAHGVAGRLEGVALNARGRRQAQELVGRLDGRPIARICSSPQQRARETAAPMAAARGLPVSVDPAFDEVDFGDWTGKSFEELERDGARWRDWCERKGSAGAPGGERFADVQRRALAGMERLARMHPDETVLVVSHGDVIKAVVAGVLGLPLDHVERFDIAPASLSIVELGSGWAKVSLVNDG